jgi:aminoglycoside phosphotransferase family enzyme/predicted kinase
MIPGAQRETVAFLASAAAHGLAPGDAVARIDTHISFVFLAGERAYKLKRAVRLPFLDFSTLAAREAACRAELAVNRRAAPALYEAVRAVTREADGRLAIGGLGEAVDWLVVMRRFDQAGLFDRLIETGGLTAERLHDLAEAIAVFHRDAPRTPEFGGVRGLAQVIESDDRTFAATALERARTLELAKRQRDGLARCTPLLERRREAGRVRRVHGDLHLRNICLVEDRPTLFDAIEFNDAFACIDIAYDLAFLLMDFDHHGRRDFANLVFNHYLAFADEELEGATSPLGALPLFLSLRAAIRAHVGATTAAAIDAAPARQRALAEADAYLDRALAYLDPPPPRLVAVGGLSGSGKSRLARAVAPRLGAAPGAVVLRSDVIRKRLAGVGLFTRLPDSAYGAAMTVRTFECLFAQAEAALAAGHSVVADAVFARPEQRAELARIAARAGVPFQGLWVEAPPAVMAERIAKRIRNPSDATLEVLELQKNYDLGPLEWPRLDSSGPRAETEKAALERLGV